jgi:hypothetical protein
LIFRRLLQPVPPSPRASSETRAASTSVGVAAIEIEAFAPSSHLVAESTLAHSQRGFDYVREQIEYDLLRHRRARWLIEIRDRDGSLQVTVLAPASSSTLARKLEPIVTLVIAYRDPIGTSGGPS